MASVDVSFTGMEAYGKQFGAEAAEKYTTGYSLWAVAAGLILAGVGAYKQYQMMEKMGDLADQQRDSLKEQTKRSLRILDEFTIPNYQKAQAKLWGYSVPYTQKIVEAYVKCGTSACEYTPDYVRATRRATARVASTFAAVRRQANRAVKPGQVGACCDNTFRLNQLEQVQLLAAHFMAERHEEDRKVYYDSFYWNRQTGAVQGAANALSHMANIYSGAGNAMQSMLGHVNSTYASQGAAVSNQLSALGNQAGFFGSLSTLGGGAAGMAYTAQRNQAILNPNSTGATDFVQQTLSNAPPQSGVTTQGAGPWSLIEGTYLEPPSGS